MSKTFGSKPVKSRRGVANSRRRPYTEDEARTLFKLCRQPETTFEQLLEALPNRNEKSIRDKIFTMGLSVPRGTK